MVHLDFNCDYFFSVFVLPFLLDFPGKKIKNNTANYQLRSVAPLQEQSRQVTSGSTEGGVPYLASEESPKPNKALVGISSFILGVPEHFPV